MTTAPETPCLATQPHHGVAARLARRLGGAVRNTIAGSLALAGALRRSAAPQPGIGHAVARNADARLAPSQARAPRRLCIVPPIPSSRPGQFAHWLGRRRHAAPSIPAPAVPAPSIPSFRANSDAPFTQEEFPGLSPEACAFFSTPLQDLDPELLHRLLGAVAETVAKLMPPEAGMTDAQELFSLLQRRFDAVPDPAMPDRPPCREQYAAPAAPADASPAQAQLAPRPETRAPAAPDNAAGAPAAVSDSKAPPQPAGMPGLPIAASAATAAHGASGAPPLMQPPSGAFCSGAPVPSADSGAPAPSADSGTGVPSADNRALAPGPRRVTARALPRPRRPLRSRRVTPPGRGLTFRNRNIMPCPSRQSLPPRPCYAARASPA